MKTWRVYILFNDGKKQYVCKSFKRERVESTAWMLSLGLVRMRPNGENAHAIEMHSPEGVRWSYTLPRPSTPEEEAAATERLKALSPEELEQRKREAGRRVSSYFNGEHPRPSPAVERAMEKFRQKVAERKAAEA